MKYVFAGRAVASKFRELAAAVPGADAEYLVTECPFFSDSDCCAVGDILPTWFRALPEHERAKYFQWVLVDAGTRREAWV